MNVMAEDISKNTIIVLVVLTLVVSVIGTYAVLEELSTPSPLTSGGGSVAGTLKLNIVTPKVPATDDGAGNIKLIVEGP